MGGNAKEYNWIEDGRKHLGKPLLLQEPPGRRMALYHLRWTVVMASSHNAASKIQQLWRKQQDNVGSEEPAT